MLLSGLLAAPSSLIILMKLLDLQHKEFFRLVFGKFRELFR